MTRVLIDTSMWIEFFAKRPQVDERSLLLMSSYILEGNAVIIHPVRAELLSGHLSQKTREEIGHCLDALPRIDADWGDKNVWDALIGLAQVAQKKELAIPGLIDRMILFSAQKAHVALWTLDKSLSKLAHVVGVAIV